MPESRVYSVRLDNKYEIIIQKAMGKDPSLDNFTSVIHYGLDLVKEKLGIQIFENGYNLHFGDTPPEIKDPSPKEKILRKIETNPEFRKNEYEIVKILSQEQIEDYKTNYQGLGMSLQEYYKGYVVRDGITNKPRKS